MRQEPMVDYRSFRWDRLNTDEFRHLKLLLYWPVFGLLFAYVERGLPVSGYHVMHCALDDYIPFCEWFIIPYLFWFIFLIGMHLYTLLYDVRAFRNMMKFIILTYSAALLIFILFPTCQHLRPVEFARDNVLTRLMGAFYAFDTNTNVCPSLHVVGSLAVLFAARDTVRFQSPGWKWTFTTTALLISISTVFLKQHSALDIAAAVLLCAFGYIMVYKHGLEAVTAAVRRGRQRRRSLEA